MVLVHGRIWTLVQTHYWQHKKWHESDRPNHIDSVMKKRVKHCDNTYRGGLPLESLHGALKAVDGFLCRLKFAFQGAHVCWGRFSCAVNSWSRERLLSGLTGGRCRDSAVVDVVGWVAEGDVRWGRRRRLELFLLDLSDFVAQWW